jgi:hypothetical protein
VDPGLVDTGVVALRFDTEARQLLVQHAVIPPPVEWELAQWVSARPGPRQPQVFVEAYRPRQHLGTDQRMITLEHAIRQVLPKAVFLPNMGVKRVITADLMQLLEVWRFPTSTHHQDLRSAARIALLGMVKDDELNWYLAEMVRETLDDRLWTVDHV